PEVTPNLSQLKSFPAIMLRTNERARTGGSLEFLERGQRVGQLEDLIVRHAQTLMDAVGVAHMSEGSCLLVGLFRGVGDSRFMHSHTHTHTLSESRVSPWQLPTNVVSAGIPTLPPMDTWCARSP